MSITREPGFMAPRIFLEDRDGLWIGWRALSQIPRVRNFCVTPGSSLFNRIWYTTSRLDVPKSILEKRSVLSLQFGPVAHPSIL